MILKTKNPLKNNKINLLLFFMIEWQVIAHPGLKDPLKFLIYLMI